MQEGAGCLGMWVLKARRFGDCYGSFVVKLGEEVGNVCDSVCICGGCICVCSEWREQKWKDWQLGLWTVSKNVLSELKW